MIPVTQVKRHGFGEAGQGNSCALCNLPMNPAALPTQIGDSQNVHKLYGTDCDAVLNIIKLLERVVK